jgi:hypothetical protein
MALESVEPTDATMEEEEDGEVVMAASIDWVTG